MVVDSDKANMDVEIFYDGILAVIVAGKARLALWESFVYSTRFQIDKNEGFIACFIFRILKRVRLFLFVESRMRIHLKLVRLFLFVESRVRIHLKRVRLFLFEEKKRAG